MATAAQLAARAKARAAAGLPPLDTPVTSSAAAELRRTGKKSTANRGKKRRLSEKNLTDEETMVWRNDVALTNSGSYFGVPERGRSLAIQARYRF